MIKLHVFFHKVHCFVKIFNNNPLLKIVNDDYLLTIINIFINDHFFQKQLFFQETILFKNDCYLFSKSSKEKGCFKKRWFFHNEAIDFENNQKTKQKTIVS